MLDKLIERQDRLLGVTQGGSGQMLPPAAAPVASGEDGNVPDPTSRSPRNELPASRAGTPPATTTSVLNV